MTGYDMSIKTTKDVQVELTSEFIINALRAEGLNVPDNAKVSVWVPGGGDWSNTDLRIEGEDTVLVQWKELEEV